MTFNGVTLIATRKQFKCNLIIFMRVAWIYWDTEDVQVEFCNIEIFFWSIFVQSHKKNPSKTHLLDLSLGHLHSKSLLDIIKLTGCRLVMPEIGLSEVFLKIACTCSVNFTSSIFLTSSSDDVSRPITLAMIAVKWKRRKRSFQYVNCIPRIKAKKIHKIICSLITLLLHKEK